MPATLQHANPFCATVPQLLLFLVKNTLEVFLFMCGLVGGAAVFVSLLKGVILPQTSIKDVNLVAVAALYLKGQALKKSKFY